MDKNTLQIQPIFHLNPNSIQIFKEMVEQNIMKQITF